MTTELKPEHIRLLPRHAEIGRLQAYFDGKQYVGKPDFWTGKRGNEVVPLRERAPCIVYPLPKASAQQVVRFTFGEGRFPVLKVEAQEDAEAATYKSLTLTEDEAEVLEHGLVDVIESAKLRSVMRTLMCRGLAERTAVAIGMIKRGTFTFECPHAKDCWPTFENDDPSAPVVKLVWCYQFEKTVIEDNRAVQKKFWFRRDVDAVAYTDFAPVEVKPGEQEVKWGAGTPTPHNFGFCPVLWIRNLDESIEPGGIDGFSLYEDLFDEFDALNFALSQRHRGITYFGTPQPYETGVEEGDGPSADGRTAVPGWTASTSPTGLGAELVKGSAPTTGAMKEKARRMAPDRIWSYEGAEVNVGLIETTGAAFEVATKHVEDIRQRLLESMSVILASMESFAKGGGDMNAKFLVLAFAPLLNLVDELRDATWWPCGLRAVLSLCLRMLSKGSDGIALPNAKKLGEIAQRFEVPVTNADGTTSTVWMLPKITPIWGEAFSPSNAEITEAVTAATTAKDGGIIPLKSAVQYVAPHFGVDDVDAVVDELEQKADEQKTLEQQASQQQADDAHAKTVEMADADREHEVKLAEIKATGPKTQPGKPKRPKT